MDDQLLKAFRSPFEQATSPARERWELFKIVSCFDSEIPTTIFRRSIRPFSQWSANGELESSPNVGLNCVRIFFKDISPKERKFLAPVISVTRRYMYLGMRAHSVKGGEWFMSMDDALRQKILNSMSAEELSTKRFDALSIILQAYPDEYSEILWEELQLQFDQVVRTTIIPFLRVINFQDVLKYCDKDIYLRKLLSFLVLQLRQHPFLEHLIREILDTSHKPDVLKECHHEITKARMVLDLQSLQRSPELPSQVYKGCLDDILQTARDASKMTNASLGMSLSTCFYENNRNDPLRTAMDFWRPVTPNHPSSMESVALAYVLRNNSALEVVPTDTSLEIKTLIGFIFARRTFYVLARTVLKDILSQIEAAYLPISWEYGIAVAEFVKCCNMTREEENGALQAKAALSKRIGLDDRADTYYLQLGLSDSLLATSGYDSAVEILEHILTKEKNNASIILKSSIRLAKAQRRLGEIFPSTKIISVLSCGVHMLDKVDDDTSSAFIEEVMCNVSYVDDGMASQYFDAIIASNTAEVGVIHSQDRITNTERISHKRETDLTSFEVVLDNINDLSEVGRIRPLSDEDEAWEKSFVFSFDNGGIRGLSMLRILKALMLRIKLKERALNPPALSSYHPRQSPGPISNDMESVTGYYPCHYIDHVAGTGFGGLIAIMLGRLRMDIDDAISEFERSVNAEFGKTSIFTSYGTLPYLRPKHDYRRFEKSVRTIWNTRQPILQNHVGGQEFPSNPSMCKTMVVGGGRSDGPEFKLSMYRIYDYHITAVGSRKAPILLPDNAIDIVIRATTEEPTKIRILSTETLTYKYEIGYINPAMEAYCGVRAMRKSTQGAALFVSFGIGSRGDLSSLFWESSLNSSAKEKDPMLRETNIDSVRYSIREMVRNDGGDYFRFEVAKAQLSKIKFDVWKTAPETETGSQSPTEPSTAEKIRQITDEYISNSEVIAELDRVAEILVRNRRLRSQTDKWETFLFGR